MPKLEGTRMPDLPPKSLEVTRGDGNFAVRMSYLLVDALASEMKRLQVISVEIEPAWIDRGGEALYLRMEHSDPRDGTTWATNHLMTQKGIVEL